MKYLLLGTTGCHLCEEAEKLVNECLLNRADIDIEQIDIADQTDWQLNYATLIPVLMQPETASILYWPFTKENVLTFINQCYD